MQTDTGEIYLFCLYSKARILTNFCFGAKSIQDHMLRGTLAQLPIFIVKTEVYPARNTVILKTQGEKRWILCMLDQELLFLCSVVSPSPCAPTPRSALEAWRGWASREDARAQSTETTMVTLGHSWF